MAHTRMMDLPSLIALETAVWEALRAGDAAADGVHLAPDFLGVYPTGFAGRDEHVGQLEGGPTVDDYTINDARAVHLSSDHVLLAYRAVYRCPGSNRSEEMYVSSIWSRIDGTWLNVFSQDTPSEPMAELP